MRQRLAGIYIEHMVLDLIRLRTLSARLKGEQPGPEASIRKILGDEHGQHVMAVARHFGAEGMLAHAEAFVPGTNTMGLSPSKPPPDLRHGGWYDGFLFSRALTIGGGTGEVQRNDADGSGRGVRRSRGRSTDDADGDRGAERADGAAGWCSMIASSTSTQAFFLEPPAAEEIFGEPDTVTGGRVRPDRYGDGRRRSDHRDGSLAVGQRDGGGLPVDPRRHGLRRQHVPVVLVPGRGGDVPRHLAQLGAAGRARWTTPSTASSCRCTARCARCRPRPCCARPLAAFPNFTLLSSCVAAVSLGIGRRAIDELLAVAEGKRPLFSSKTLADRVHADRAGPGRGRPPGGAGVPPRRGRPHVGPGGQRRAGRHPDAARCADVRHQRRHEGGRGRRPDVHAGRRVERVPVQRAAALPARRPRPGGPPACVVRSVSRVAGRPGRPRRGPPLRTPARRSATSPAVPTRPTASISPSGRRAASSFGCGRSDRAKSTRSA